MDFTYELGHDDANHQFRTAITALALHAQSHHCIPVVCDAFSEVLILGEVDEWKAGGVDVVVERLHNCTEWMRVHIRDY